MARAAHLSHSPPRPGERRPAAQEKGRGAGLNMPGRYEKLARESFDEGWGVETGDYEFDDGPLRTDVTIEKPRKIITYNNSPFVGFDRSINPYRGCEHGCVYCFARPAHAYMGLSPGLDFETKLFAKPGAEKLLANELSNPRYKPRAVAMGTNTDPYQPVERKFSIMRGIISTFARFNHPFTILTKSHLVTRDIDLLAPLAQRNLTRVMISLTTLDKSLARHMEPRASAPGRRLEAIGKLSEAGIPTGVMTAPMIPALNDDEMESLLKAAKDAGASFAGYTVIRLPLEVSPLFQEWLENFAPGRAARVMRHIRDMNGGKTYDVEWSRGRQLKSVYAKLLSQRFKKAIARLGLEKDQPPLDLTQFAKPPEATPQLGLFD